MQKLAVKTLGGTIVLEIPPNGGWAWIVTLCAFVAYGSAGAIPKTQGIFFIDIKNEFSISNTAVSWMLTVILGTLTFAGFLGKLMMRWLDARQVVMVGGVLSCSGLIVMSASPYVAIMYFGAIVAGFGYGISCVQAMSQISLYFSTWRPMANGIALSGSTVLGTVIPYLNQYLLDEYGWRGAYLVLGGIGLNTCVAGALIRPISVISESSNLKPIDDKPRGTTEPCTSKLISNAETMNSFDQPESNRSSDETTANKENNPDSYLKLLQRYWLAFGFLFANFLLALCVYAPNFFIVPYAKELGTTAAQSTRLLSFISAGDFFGRIGVGLAVSKFSILNQNLHFGISAIILFLVLVQFVVIYLTTFPALMMYVTAYGAFYGAFATMCVSFVGQALNPKIVESGMAAFYASAGLGYLASGPIAGAVVDKFGSYQVVFWFTMISLLVGGIIFTLLSLLLRRRGKLV